MDQTMHMNVAGQGTKFEADGDNTVLCKRINSICESEVTLIKLDIEGVEKAALKGAAEVIKNIS